LVDRRGAPRVRVTLVPGAFGAGAPQKLNTAAGVAQVVDSRAFFGPDAYP